jgi:hypothetical protein
MFFIGIFGVEQTEKEIRSWNLVCPGCGKMTKAVFYLSYTYFHIFFIPTFRWKRRYYIRLRCCGSVYEAPEDYAQTLKVSDNVDFSCLTKTQSGFGGWESFYTSCPSCGRSFEKGFPYCPYCGTKQQ